LKKSKPKRCIHRWENMKKNKACGPDELPMEIVKALGQEGEKWMVKVLNKWHPS